jgi:hypothetical protein
MANKINMNRPVRNIRATYKQNKSTKVGDTCYCPSCGQPFEKKYYQQAFCKSKSGTKCKDKYWNTVTHTKRNNKTRISPASARFMAEREVERDYRSVYDSFHPFEGLNDDEYKNF